jgi:hypothetical protein
VPLLDASTTSAVAVVGVAVGGVGLLLAGAAQLRLTRLRHSYAALLGDAKQADLVSVVGQHVESVQGLDGQVRATQQEVAVLRRDLHAAIRHVAVVRYDAFGDMGGRLSFSAALLDDAGDGLILTSINGRTETRSYAKGVKNGASEHQLSPEEQQAVGYAVKAASRSTRMRSPAAAPAEQ